MAVFYSGVFYSGVYFTDSAAADVKTGTGGIDPSDAVRRRRHVVKPTGLLHLPRKEGRKDAKDRVDESRAIQAEIAGRLVREFTEESSAIIERQAVEEMTMAEVEREIGVLLRKKLRTQEDEAILLLLLVAIAV